MRIRASVLLVLGSGAFLLQLPATSTETTWGVMVVESALPVLKYAIFFFDWVHT